MLLEEIKVLKIEKDELLQNYEKEVMHNGLRGQQVNDTKTELEAMTDLYAGVSVQNTHLVSEVENLKNEIIKIESNHKEVLEKMVDQETETKKRHADSIREAKKEYQELSIKLQTNQELLDTTTKELEVKIFFIFILCDSYK